MLHLYFRISLSDPGVQKMKVCKEIPKRDFFEDMEALGPFFGQGKRKVNGLDYFVGIMFNVHRSHHPACFDEKDALSLR